MNLTKELLSLSEKKKDKGEEFDDDWTKEVDEFKKRRMVDRAKARLAKLRDRRGDYGVQNEDAPLYAVVDINDPKSDDYFVGTKSECDQWLEDNEHNDQFKGKELDLEPVNESTEEIDALLEDVHIPKQFTVDLAHARVFTQGYKHGLAGGAPISTKNMLIPTHADAYNAGYKAGAAKRGEATVAKSDVSSVAGAASRMGEEAVSEKAHYKASDVRKKGDAVSVLVHSDKGGEGYDGINVVFRGDDVDLIADDPVAQNEVRKNRKDIIKAAKAAVASQLGEEVFSNDVRDFLVEERRSADQLEIGDAVEITGHVNFKGHQGEITRFGKDKKFVVVKLSNGGEHSFHSSDVSETDSVEDVEDDDDSHEEHDKFYVAFYNEDEERSWIGLVSKEGGGKWHEKSFVGKPDYRWGQSYMSYLTPDDIMSWIHKDYTRNVEIEGPFFDADEAKNHVRHNWGKIEEGFKKVNPNSQERVSYDRKDRRVSTPKGEGVVTSERKEPTFSQTVPFVHRVYVKLDDGKTASFNVKEVKFMKVEGISSLDLAHALMKNVVEAAQEDSWEKGKTKLQVTSDFKTLKKGQVVTYDGKFHGEGGAIWYSVKDENGKRHDTFHRHVKPLKEDVDETSLEAALAAKELNRLNKRGMSKEAAVKVAAHSLSGQGYSKDHSLKVAQRMADLIFEANVNESVEDDQSEIVGEFENLLKKAYALGNDKKLEKSKIGNIKKKFDEANDYFAEIHRDEDGEDVEDALDSALDSMKEIVDELKELIDSAKVDESVYTNYANWKEAILLSHPAHAKDIKFRGKMEGEKTTVVAGIGDRVLGTWEEATETGHVISEANGVLNGWKIKDESYTTRGNDPTAVTKWVLTKDGKRVTIKEFFGEWSVNGEQAKDKSAANVKVKAMTGATLDAIEREIHKMNDYSDDPMGDPSRYK